MDLSRNGRTRLLVGGVAIVSLLSTAVVAQSSVLAAVGRRVSLGDLGGLVFVAWVTLLLVVAIANATEAADDGRERR